MSSIDTEPADLTVTMIGTRVPGCSSRNSCVTATSSCFSRRCRGDAFLLPPASRAPRLPELPLVIAVAAAATPSPTGLLPARAQTRSGFLRAQAAADPASRGWPRGWRAACAAVFSRSCTASASRCRRLRRAGHDAALFLLGEPGAAGCSGGARRHRRLIFGNTLRRLFRRAPRRVDIALLCS